MQCWYIPARTDSGGKTDLSEASTCTTEDYVTANDTNNSGTDTSSRRSFPQASGAPATAAGEGSSFESASSIYSLAREMNNDDVIQVTNRTFQAISPGIVPIPPDP